MDDVRHNTSRSLKSRDMNTISELAVEKVPGPITMHKSKNMTDCLRQKSNHELSSLHQLYYTLVELESLRLLARELPCN